MQPPGAMLQFAYVVPDLNSALEYWINVLNAGPFFVFERLELVGHKYRGTPSNPSIALALTNSGNIQIELIAPNDDEPSVYREFLERGGTGIHHVGYTPRDFDAEIEKYRQLGCDVALEGSLDGGTRIVYMDTAKQVGHLTELWEPMEEILGLFQAVEDAAAQWDGAEPIRRM